MLVPQSRLHLLRGRENVILKHGFGLIIDDLVGFFGWRRFDSGWFGAPVWRRPLQLPTGDTVRQPAMWAMGVIMTEVLGGNRIQRGVHRVFIKGERFMAMGTADLHGETP